MTDGFIPYCYVCGESKTRFYDDDLGHDRWRCESAKCDEIRSREFDQGPFFHTTRLKNDRETGTVASERAREITDTAKAEGREIQRPTY
jgi:hypothetical protein